MLVKSTVDCRSPEGAVQRSPGCEPWARSQHGRQVRRAKQLCRPSGGWDEWTATYALGYVVPSRWGY